MRAVTLQLGSSMSEYMSGHMDYVRVRGVEQEASKRMIHLTARQGSESKDSPACSVALT